MLSIGSLEGGGPAWLYDTIVFVGLMCTRIPSPQRGLRRSRCFCSSILGLVRELPEQYQASIVLIKPLSGRG